MSIDIDGLSKETPMSTLVQAQGQEPPPSPQSAVISKGSHEIRALCVSVVAALKMVAALKRVSHETIALDVETV